MQQSLHVTTVLAAHSGQVYILAVSSAVNYVMLHFCWHQTLDEHCPGRLLLLSCRQAGLLRKN